jgi:hypothetical protein
MDTYAELYEFAASVGALEGYVYPKEKVDTSYLPNWIEHLRKAYELLPGHVRDEIQPNLDKTLGRAVRSLIEVLGENHPLVVKLMGMIKGKLPSSYDDFQKKKWFE